MVATRFSLKSNWLWWVQITDLGFLWAQSTNRLVVTQIRVKVLDLSTDKLTKIGWWSPSVRLPTMGLYQVQIIGLKST